MRRPGLSKMLLRGALRRCPWCGGRGGFFTGWFRKASSCRSCGLQWRRGDVGFELGAAAMTAIITFGPLLAVLGVMVAAMWPDIEVVPLFGVLVVLAVCLPFVTYGLSYLMWQAVDIVMRPPEPGDFDLVDDAADAPTGSTNCATPASPPDTA